MKEKESIYRIKLEANLLGEKTEEELSLRIEKIKKSLNFKRSEKVLKVVDKEGSKEGKDQGILNDILVEWFALVQEVSFRKIGLRHFDTQLLAGIFLHQGKIVEMKTGEGKTLASTLPISLNALKGKGVHVVTVNDYLAERDKNWMGKIYQGLNLSVGLVKSEGNQEFDFLGNSNYELSEEKRKEEKRKNYQADITYLTNFELVFDYLRDSSASYENEIVQRAFNYCIIDEIDSILIDEARTPLILSTSEGEINFKKLSIAKVLANTLEKTIDFEIDEKRREINLTEKGYQEAKKKLGKESLYDLEDPWILEILNALKAKYLFLLNKDYIVLNNKILIVDEFTGRVMNDRRWSLGIHEAIEMKENVEIGNPTRTKSSITYQNFFTLYPKLAGMTGTAKTADKEFKDIYNLDVIVLPTSKEMIRKDLSDFVYQTELAKWKAVLKKSKECFEIGQPILIGTSTVEKSEFLSDLFKASKIPHQVLNALPENIARESQIVAQAGEPYRVTIATNMAGRGTDIILGGNPSFKVKQILMDIFLNKKSKDSIYEIEEGKKEGMKQSIFDEIDNLQKKIFEESDLEEKVLKNHILNLPYSLDNCCESLKILYNFLYEKIYQNWEKNNQFVKTLGGLFVLGTERHETRRIDNQLRGRAGRQGDPGISQFFVSLDDELIKIFGGESIRRWLDYLMTDKDIPLESKFLTQSLENAQKKVESYYYETRKNVFQYDEIINLQRNELFKIRKNFLSKDIYNDLALRYGEFTFDLEIQNFEKKIKKKKLNNFFYALEKYFGHYSTVILQNNFTKRKSLEKKMLFSLNYKNLNKEFYKEIWISNDLRFAKSNLYQLGFLKNTQSTTLLSIIDFYWTEHIDRLNYIRDTINWRAYGQTNPLIEYNMEAFYSYQLMLEEIRFSMLYYFLEIPIF